MISKVEWASLYNRVAMIEYLMKHGGGSKTHVVRGTGITYDKGYPLISVMINEGFIETKDVGRNHWIILRPKGKLLYDKHKELLEMII